jgi:RNA polymerase sigma factor (sigma-70 family)
MEQTHKTVEAESDEKVMESVKNGQLVNMSVLFERYHVSLYNFFLKLTKDKDISQDLTQNLFYRMIKYRQTYNNGYPVRAWIFQIARNIHSDHYKQIRKSDLLFIRSESYPTDVIEESHGYKEDDYVRLENALCCLNDEQKEILVLSRYQGLKYEEISRITSQSVPAIKVAVHRALKQLRGIYFKQT